MKMKLSVKKDDSNRMGDFFSSFFFKDENSRNEADHVWIEWKKNIALNEQGRKWKLYAYIMAHFTESCMHWKEKYANMTGKKNSVGMPEKTVYFRRKKSDF